MKLFNKLFYTILILINILILYISQFFSDLIPFYIVFGSFLLTCVLVLLVNQFTRANGISLSKKIERLIDNGKVAYFLTFLAVLDTLIFMFIVPQSSLTVLENDYQSSFIFYGLVVFLIPILIIKFTLEPNGKEIENLFWVEYQAQIKNNKPSMAFALFILARVQLKATPFQAQQKQSNQ